MTAENYTKCKFWLQFLFKAKLFFHWYLKDFWIMLNNGKFILIIIKYNLNENKNKNKIFKEMSFKYKIKKLILNARSTMPLAYTQQQKQLTYQLVTWESSSSHYPSMTILFLRVNLVILIFFYFFQGVLNCFSISNELRCKYDCVLLKKKKRGKSS